jgi:hypothetical protein
MTVTGIHQDQNWPFHWNFKNKMVEKIIRDTFIYHTVMRRSYLQVHLH